MQDTKASIKAFLAQHIRSTNLKDDTDIFSEGYVNSLFAMQLIGFLESDFHLTIENEDLKLDNFRSVNALTELVKRKKTDANR